MTGYNIPDAIHGEVNLPDLGTVTFDFEAGTIDPADEAQDALLASLVPTGLVELTISATPKNKATKSDTPSEDKE